MSDVIDPPGKISISSASRFPKDVSTKNDKTLGLQENKGVLPYAL